MGSHRLPKAPKAAAMGLQTRQQSGPSGGGFDRLGRPAPALFLEIAASASRSGREPTALVWIGHYSGKQATMGGVAGGGDLLPLPG